MAHEAGHGQHENNGAAAVLYYDYTDNDRYIEESGEYDIICIIRSVFTVSGRAPETKWTGRNAMQYFIGLDIGATKCAVVLAHIQGGIRILDKIRFATETDRGFRYAYGKLCESIETILARNHIGLENVDSIGISCGGPLDTKNGIVLSPPNLPGWDAIPLTEMLAKRYGVRAFLQNDANACALAEWMLGAGRGAQTMVFLTMGSGMGAGIIAEGSLLRGCNDMAGEIGHIRLTEDGPPGYGKAGSIEGYVSGNGIARQAREWTRNWIAQGTPPKWIGDGCTVDALDAQTMADYARNGDPQATAFFDHIGYKLGCSVAMLADLLNPERVIIGSIFTRCEGLLRPAMEQALKNEALPHNLKCLEVLPAQLGEQLGDLASVMAALYARGIDPMSDG